MFINEHESVCVNVINECIYQHNIDLEAIFKKIKIWYWGFFTFYWPTSHSSCSSGSEFVSIASVSNISFPRPHKVKDLALRPKKELCGYQFNRLKINQLICIEWWLIYMPHALIVVLQFELKGLQCSPFTMMIHHFPKHSEVTKISISASYVKLQMINVMPWRYTIGLLYQTVGMV